MITAMNTALAGVRAATVRAEIHAGNISIARTTAPLDPSGYAAYGPKAAVLTSGPGGPQVAVRSVKPQFNPVFWPGHPDANADGLVGLANVDLATEIVGLQQAARTYEANLAVFRTADRMLGALIDATT
ncbi:MAG: flagellar basal body rod protein FlgC [Alphaproteobacteria bacterium]